MPDAIPGAVYHDDVFDDRFTCNGTVERDDGELYVVLEFDSADDPVTVHLDLFREAESIELIEHPSG